MKGFSNLFTRLLTKNKMSKVKNEYGLWKILDACNVYGVERQELEKKIKPIISELVISNYISGYNRAEKGREMELTSNIF